MASTISSIALIATILIGISLGIEITITPENMSAMGSNVSLTCDVSGNNTDVQTIQVVELTKGDDEPIAIIRMSECGTHVISVASQAIQAEGEFKDIDSGTFNVVIAKPKNSDSGEYTCSMQYVDQSGLLKHDSAKGNLMVEEITPEDLHKIIEDLQKKVEALEMKQQGADNSSSSTTTAPATNPPPPVTPKNELVSAFAVTKISREVPIIVGKNLVLPDIISIEGPGYNALTGEYTAPVRGLYVFHLTVALASRGSSSIVQLRRGNSVLFRVYAADKTYDDQTAASTAVVLEAGEKVYAVVEGVRGKRQFDDRMYTLFSGYLLNDLSFP